MNTETAARPVEGTPLRRKGNSGRSRSGKKVVTASTILAGIDATTPSERTLAHALESTSHSLMTFRERCEQLMKEKEGVSAQMRDQEVDLLDMITTIKRDSDQKDLEIRKLTEMMKDDRERWTRDKNLLTAGYETQVRELHEALHEEEAQFKMMQQELTEVKEFRRKRQEMLKDIEMQRTELMELERQHKGTIDRMEKKFLEDKLRLQREANQKISELAMKAHKEAVVNLDETTKSIYRENLQMVEALDQHARRVRSLEKSNAELLSENRRLSTERETHDQIIKDKIVQTKYQSIELRDLQEKIVAMEDSLTHVVKEFERERENLVKMTTEELEHVKEVARHLKEQLRRKCIEMKHIRYLAQHILNQRTDLERFFMDALESCRQEIYRDREQKRKELPRRLQRYANDAKIVSQMLVGETPAQAADRLSNQQQKQPQPQPQEQAKPPHNDEANEDDAAPKANKIDIADLSWDDKQRILRLLFAKMNGVIADETLRKSFDHIEMRESRAYKQDQMVRQALLSTNQADLVNALRASTMLDEEQQKEENISGSRQTVVTFDAKSEKAVKPPTRPRSTDPKGSRLVIAGQAVKASSNALAASSQLIAQSAAKVNSDQPVEQKPVADQQAQSALPAAGSQVTKSVTFSTNDTIISATNQPAVPVPASIDAQSVNADAALNNNNQTEASNAGTDNSAPTARPVPEDNGVVIPAAQAIELLKSTELSALSLASSSDEMSAPSPDESTDSLDDDAPGADEAAAATVPQ